MTTYIGLDIGGTKIAAAAFSHQGEILAQQRLSTPDNYESFLSLCSSLVKDMALAAIGAYTVGICLPGAIDHERGTTVSGNLPFLKDKFFRDDLKRVLGHDIRIANDMNCAALAEAVDGAGQGCSTVICVTLSTGVACGYVVHGHIIDGPNGLTGEFGQVPLPFREKEDSPLHSCICRQTNCIEKAICGGGLSRLYTAMTGQTAEPPEIAALAREGNQAACAVLDRYYEMVAKAMMVILYTYDPEIIIISGGLSKLPGLFEAVPHKWGKYCLVEHIKTRFVPAMHGALAGLRGAAWLGRT